MNEREITPLVIYDGHRNFRQLESCEEHHVMIVEHSQFSIVEIIVFNAALCIESPRIYLNLDSLLANFAQSDVQEKFSDIRKMMMRQKQIAQIIQFINTRLTIPSYEIKEEFAAVIIPKAGDDANSVIPPDNVLGQFHKPRDLVPYETGRKKPLTFLESDFTSLLIKWHKEFNAVALANERSATYQSNAQVAIEGFAKRRPPLKRTNSMNSRDGNVKVAAVARARWVAGATNTSKAEKAEKASRKLAKQQQQLNTASIASSNSSTIHETDHEHVESELLEEALPSAVDEFYLKLLRFHYELPFLAQSSDRAAYLETLVFSVSELFGSNLERFKRSNSFLERYSPARQRWIKAFRKINTRNHTMGVRKRLQKSPSSRHLLLVKEHIYGSEAIKSLSHTNTRQNSDVSIVSQGIDPALIFRVEQLLGAEWLSSEQDFFALLNKLNRDIRTLSTQSKRAAYLEGLTAVVVNRFSHQLQRLKKANTMREALTLPRQRWVKAIDKVRSMLYTAKLRVRLVRSPSARHLLGVKQQSAMVNDMVARAKVSSSNNPKRHTRRDDVMIRDLPQGYKQSGDAVNNSAANISAVPSRGLEKSSLTDAATTAGTGQSKGLRRIPSGRLQRQVGNNKITDARRRGNHESSTLQHSNSLRPTMSKQHSSVMLGKLSKSVSTSAASDYTGKHSTLNALDTPSIAELDKVPGGSQQRTGRNSLLQRFTDPFVRKTFKKGTVSPTAQQSTSNTAANGFLKLSGGDVTTDRDSLDSRDFPSECVSGESASATPHSMSPSLLYQRLVQSSQQRSRAGSESDSVVHRSGSNDISGTSTPPLKVLNKSAPSSQHKFSLLNRNHHSNRIVPVTAFEADFGEKLVVVASPGGGSLSRVNTVSNSTSRDSEDYFYVPHDDFRNSNSGSNSRNHSRNNSILKVNTLDSYDSDTNTASNRGLNSTERLYFSEESPSGPSELSPYVAGASSRNSNNNSSKYSAVGDGGGKSAVYFTKSAPSTPDGTKDTYNNRRVIASSSNAKLGGPHTPPRTLVATQSIRNMNGSLDTQTATTGTSTNQSHSSSRHVNTYGGSGAQYKKYDTLGDIARKYNIDAATIHRGGEGSSVVPRYAQSTIKSLIRNSNVHDDNVL